MAGLESDQLFTATLEKKYMNIVLRKEATLALKMDKIQCYKTMHGQWISERFLEMMLMKVMKFELLKRSFCFQWLWMHSKEHLQDGVISFNDLVLKFMVILCCKKVPSYILLTDTSLFIHKTDVNYKWLLFPRSEKAKALTVETECCWEMDSCNCLDNEKGLLLRNNANKCYKYGIYWNTFIIHDNEKINFYFLT